MSNSLPDSLQEEQAREIINSDDPFKTLWDNVIAATLFVVSLSVVIWFVQATWKAIEVST